MFAEKPVKGPEEEVVELLDGSREGKPEININLIKYLSLGTCFKAPEKASAPNIIKASHHLWGHLHMVKVILQVHDSPLETAEAFLEALWFGLKF